MARMKRIAHHAHHTYINADRMDAAFQSTFPGKSHHFSSSDLMFICHSRNQKCDGIINCADGSDELECQNIEQRHENISNLRFDSENSTLRWDGPQSHNDSIPVYYVSVRRHFYADGQPKKSSVEGLFDEPQAKLLNLDPCSRYIAGVSLLDANWTHDIPEIWLRFKSPNDLKSPPINLSYSTIGKTIRLTWDHRCILKYTQPSQYVVKINDLTQKVSETKTVDGLSFVYRMKEGSEYSFEVSTTHPDAISAILSVEAPKNVHALEIV